MAWWRSPCLVLVMVLACDPASDPEVDDTPADDPEDTENPVDTEIMEEEDICETSVITWETFGEGFTLTWCTPCHTSHLSGDDRQGATDGVDFDTKEGALEWIDRIEARATGDAPTMPPTGGPPSGDLEALAEWIYCGAQ